MQRTRVFIASSLDGFIAGPDDELDWLDPGEGAEDTFSTFFSEVGCLLMGRRTYDIVSAFSGPWPYGETPVWVATHNTLPNPRRGVTPVEGTIEELIGRAKDHAGERDVYVDGGALIRSALSAGLVDELTITVIPMILGRGVPLFAGLEQRQPLTLIGQRSIGASLVELRYRPKRG